MIGILSRGGGAISGTGVIENKHSTARSTFARVWVNAHTDARTRFVIADRPHTIVWAFTHNLANVELAVYGDLAVGRVFILNNPRLHGGVTVRLATSELEDALGASGHGRGRRRRRRLGGCGLGAGACSAGTCQSEIQSSSCIRMHHA